MCDNSKKYIALIVDERKISCASLQRACRHFMRYDHAIHLTSAICYAHEAAYDVAFVSASLPDACSYSAIHALNAIAPELAVIALVDNQQLPFATQQGAQDRIIRHASSPADYAHAMHYAVISKKLETLLALPESYHANGIVAQPVCETQYYAAYAYSARYNKNMHLSIITMHHPGYGDADLSENPYHEEALLARVATYMPDALLYHYSDNRYMLFHHDNYDDTIQLCAKITASTLPIKAAQLHYDVPLEGVTLQNIGQHAPSFLQLDAFIEQSITMPLRVRHA